MKTNKMLRLASILMVAAMISTCAISGTFAKYVTSDSVEDEARVAKWGVTIVADGTLFDTTYLDAAGNNLPGEGATEPDISVKSSNTDKLVAPGTKNTKGITFEISGTPEVDFALNIVTSFNDIVLPAGTYKDYTKGNAWTADTPDTYFDLTEDYHPVKFTLTNGAGTKVVDAGTIEDVCDKLTALKANYNALDVLDTLDGNTDGTYTLTWEWSFEGAQTLNGINFDADTVDKADTYLGNVISGIITDPNAKTTLSFDIEITATQID